MRKNITIVWLKPELIGRVRPTLLPPTETISIRFCLGFSYLLFKTGSHKDQLVLNSPHRLGWPPVPLDFTVQVLGLQLGSTAPSLRLLSFRKLLHLHEEPCSYSHPASSEPLRTDVRLFHQSLRSTWMQTGLTHSLEDPLYTVILIFKTLLVDTMKSSPRGLPSNRELKINILTPYCLDPPWAMEALRVELGGNSTHVVF